MEDVQHELLASRNSTPYDKFMVQFIDPNNVDFRDAWPSVGEVSGLKHYDKTVIISGTTPNEPSMFHLVVDAARRFVHAAPVSGFSFALLVDAKCLKINTWPLSVYLYDPETNIAQPFAMSVTLEDPNLDQTRPPSFRKELTDVLRKARGFAYTSLSSHNDIKTGNNYQSIDLDTQVIAGGRPSRNIFFDHVNFKGKTVLDIGANTGENSRLARRRGASLVDGYEYDVFFVEQGRSINALSGATRVSLFQGDATNPALYAGMKYDIIVAFSVWVYIDKLLDTLAQVSDTVFFETHTLDHGLQMYLDGMQKVFPFVRLMGHVKQTNMTQSRAVLMFSKTQQALDAALTLKRIRVEPYFRNNFFDKHKKTTPSELASYARQMRTKVTDGREFSYIGDTYFELLLAGYAEYLDARSVTSENIFLRNYSAMISAGRVDKSLTYLVADPVRMIEKITAKYRDFDNAVRDAWNLIPPIVIPPSGAGKFKFTTDDGRVIYSDDIDGHHRWFLAQLLQRPTMDALVGEPVAVKREVLQPVRS